MATEPYIVVPTSGQLQIPGAFQSYARVIVSVTGRSSVSEVFAGDGNPSLGVPDFGLVAWRYDHQGVQRYGKPVLIRFTECLLVSDQPQFESDRVLVVPRPGVDLNVSLRRIAI